MQMQSPQLDITGVVSSIVQRAGDGNGRDGIHDIVIRIKKQGTDPVGRYVSAFLLCKENRDV